jgi:hypothetical protein
VPGDYCTLGVAPLDGQPPTVRDSHFGKIICSDLRTFFAHFSLWKSKFPTDTEIRKGGDMSVARLVSS